MRFPHPPRVKDKPLPAEFPDAVQQKLTHPDRARRILAMCGAIGGIFGILIGTLISLVLRTQGVPFRFLILITLIVGWFGIGWGMRMGKRIVFEAIFLSSKS